VTSFKSDLPANSRAGESTSWRNDPVTGRGGEGDTNGAVREEGNYDGGPGTRTLGLSSVYCTPRAGGRLRGEQVDTAVRVILTIPSSSPSFSAVGPIAAAAAAATLLAPYIMTVTVVGRRHGL